MAVTRDYIPTDDSMTDLERARLNRHAAIRTGVNHQDYIPADGDTGPAKSSGPSGSDRALNAAVARAQLATTFEWDRAVERLKAWDIGQAVDAMNGMPLRIMQMYLIAEMKHSAREDILKRFPLPDPLVVAQFAPEMLVGEAEPVVLQGDGPGKLGEPAPAAEVMQTADLGDTGPLADAFLCVDCDLVAGSLAGLKAHVRAKHPNGDPVTVTPASTDSTPQAGE